MTPHLADTPVIETDRLRLRAPVAGDWPHWRSFAMSERAQYIGGPYEEKMAWRGFAHVTGMWVLRGYGSFVITAKGDDTPLGMAGPWHPIEWPEREIGWTLWTPDAEGKGYAYEAARAARDHAFRDLGWDTAVSYIDVGNDRSVALALRLGAVHDAAATPPHTEKPMLVYRHSRTEADR